MRNARFTGWGAAALTAVLVATASSPALALEAEPHPVPTETSSPETPVAAETPAAETPAPEAAPAQESPAPVPTDSSAPAEESDAAPAAEAPVAVAAATGDLVVRSFDDYYADGVYDPSKTGRDGRSDQNTNGRLYEARTSEGARAFATVNADGDYLFTDLPVGETTVYFTHPNNPAESVFFDATGATSAADIERLPNGSNPYAGTTGVATVNVDEDGESIVVGFTSVGASVAVKNPDGTPAVGLTGIEFGSGGEWYAATEYAGLAGSYEALIGSYGMGHLPDEIGLRIAAPAGFQIGEVTAVDNISSRTIALTERDGGWWADTLDLQAYFSSADFTVALEALPTGDLTITRFDDRYADGLFDSSKVALDGTRDEKRTSNSLWLQTVDGAWHYGSANADGDYVFADVPQGDAQVFLGFPNAPAQEVLFDATGATSADDIRRLPVGERFGEAGVADVTIDADGEALLIGMSSVNASVAVKNPEGTPATGLTGIEFGSGGEWFDATEYAGLPGSYEALVGYTGLAHLPDEIGLRVEAPAGYEVGTVTAVDNISSRTLDLVERDGAWWVDTTDLQTYFSAADFTVTLDELPTGDLVVRSFDDYYADGVYDPSKTALDRRTDRNTNGRLYEAITATGARAFATENADGDYVFTDLPVGETKVYFLHPNNPGESVFFDATGAESAADIERLPNGTNPFAGTAGVATVNVDEDGEQIVVGFTSIGSSVAVKNPDGTPAVGLTGIAFGSGGEWFPATEYEGRPGSYEALDGSYGMAHLPDEIGLRIDAPAGYRVGEVTLGDALTWPLQPVPFTERDGAYWFDTVDLQSYFSRGDFTVTLEELPTASVEVTYFSDVVLDGLFEATADLPIVTAELYLHDAEGDWWATTAGADGTYRFPGAAIGPATIYAEVPASDDSAGIPGIELPESALSVWDATGLTSYRDTVRAATETISFDGSSIDPETGAVTPISLTDALVGVIPADLAEGEQQREIGSATIFQLAAITDAAGNPFAGVDLEFLSNGESTSSVELEPGAYVATDGPEVAVFGAAEFGIRATPQEGFEVVGVTALSLDGDVLEVETPTPGASARMAVFAAGPEYRVAPGQVGGPIGGVVWAVQVAPIVAPVDPGTTPPLTGTDPGADLPRSGAATARGSLAATGGSADASLWLGGAALLLLAGAALRFARRRTV